MAADESESARLEDVRVVSFSRATRSLDVSLRETDVVSVGFCDLLRLSKELCEMSCWLGCS